MRFIFLMIIMCSMIVVIAGCGNKVSMSEIELDLQTELNIRSWCIWQNGDQWAVLLKTTDGERTVWAHCYTSYDKGFKLLAKERAAVFQSVLGNTEVTR